MKEYILKADNRRPLKFNGELLGQYPNFSKEEIVKNMDENPNNYQCSGGQTSSIKLELYRTQAGKVILMENRITLFADYIDHIIDDIKLEVFTDFQAYVDTVAKKSGFLTSRLLNLVIENHPELEVHWVESID